ncbi:unnamed protein product [Cladocopium goreaui]|uniref:Phosphoenolpyruvate synthase (PEP synthase) (Pyruvate, water dikinase) n=1 Tax=Cladocopium goreaui TaxID=2562237 RepID=A0A9P1CK59_9DINO|nr:unnamed protein product [Cladocopium goreaui]
MIPFVRTLEMAKDVNEVLASRRTSWFQGLKEKNGLKQGEDGLKVNMMAELPSNVFLAEEFLEYFGRRSTARCCAMLPSVYPKRSVQLSDFKSNEYKSLIGGEQHEPSRIP